MGLDCRRDGPQARRRIGYLPSEYRLYENLTGRRPLLAAALWAWERRDLAG